MLIRLQILKKNNNNKKKGHNKWESEQNLKAQPYLI